MLALLGAHPILHVSRVRVKNCRTYYSIQSSFHPQMHPYTNPYDPSKHPSTTTHHSVQAQIYPHIDPSSKHLSIHTHSYMFTGKKRQSRDLLVLVKCNWHDQNLPCFPAHMPSVKRKARALCNPTCINLSCSLLCLCTLQNKSHQHIKSYYSCKKCNIKHQVTNQSCVNSLPAIPLQYSQSLPCSEVHHNLI
jgi:hypothetical protein